MKHLNLLFEYLSRYKSTIYKGLLFVTISNLCSAYAPRVVGNMVDKLNSGNYQMSAIMEQILYILLLTIGSGLFMYLTRQTIIVASRLIEYDLKQDLIKSFSKRDMNFFHKNSTGSLMALATNDIPAAREFIGPAVMYGANTLTTFSFSLYFMLSLNWEISLISMIPLPIITIATYYLGKKVHVAFKDVQEQFASLTSSSQESISGIRIIKSYVREKYESGLFSSLSSDYADKNLRLARLQSAFMPVLMVLVGLSNALVLGYGGLKVMSGAASLGDLTQFFIYLNMLIWPVAAIGWITNIVQRASASAARLEDMFKADSSTENAELGIELKSDKATIKFENLSLKYENSNNYALKNIDLEVTQGSTVGIIGPVGSGKSSLINLIARLFEYSEGKLEIGGRDIRDYSLKSLRENIGFVAQDTFLFSMTIEENIRFGKSDATIEEIREAARIACLDEEIETFSDSYSTMLGERGITLSGGQKQRLALARAIVKQPNILILDDSLSAVDSQTEEKLLKNLKQFMKDRSTFIVSHRMSAVSNSDIIIALKDGEIIEKGDHNTLLEKNIYYAKLYELQKLEAEIDSL